MSYDVIDAPAIAARSPWRSGRPRLRTALVLVLGLAVSTTAAGLYGSRRMPTPPASGDRLGGAISRAAPARSTLRVGTFNIHGGKGLDRRRDLSRTAALLEAHDFDLVGLNEVHGRTLVRDHDQAQRLGELLDTTWLFAPTERRWWRDDFGNGLLSALPVLHWQRLPLERIESETYRNVLLAVVEHRGVRIHLMVTHIDCEHAEDRVAQFRAVAALFAALAEPVILVGDLNTSGADPMIDTLRAAPHAVDAVASSLGDDAPPHIDWILVRGLVVVDAGIEASDVSDHPLVWAELALPQAAETSVAELP